MTGVQTCALPIYSLPVLSVQSANVAAYGADLYIPGILGQGATFTSTTDRAGSISSITIDWPGEDYISTPNVSLKVEDIVVSNVNIAFQPQKDDIVYQGVDLDNATYKAYANNIVLLSKNYDPALSLYNLRVYNYTSRPDPTQILKVDGKPEIQMVMANTAYSSDYDSNGIRIYGDGSAKATASFLNGLVIGQGTYLNTQGQPSSFDVLQSSIYNNYTYQVTVQQSISSYRDILLNLLHPTGMKVIGRYGNLDEKQYDYHALTALKTGRNLYSYTGTAASAIQVYADWTNKSNNILKFTNLSGANIANIVFANSIISLDTLTGPDILGDVVSIDAANDQVTITNNVWLTFMNVAYVSANTGSNVINIKTVTNTYDMVNNGNYSNTAYPLMDVVFAGDNIKIGSVYKTVDYVDIAHNKIYVANNFAANISNSLMSVNRVLTAGGQVSRQDEIIIYGPVGTQYVP